MSIWGCVVKEKKNGCWCILFVHVTGRNDIGGQSFFFSPNNDFFDFASTTAWIGYQFKMDERVCIGTKHRHGKILNREYVGGNDAYQLLKH